VIFPAAIKFNVGQSNSPKVHIVIEIHCNTIHTCISFHS